jgi:hypothetical protein
MTPSSVPDDLSFIQEFDCDSDVLLIAFAGLHTDRVVPSFHWRGVFEHLPVKRLFVRDLNQFFYQRGLPGYSTGILGTADYLAGVLERNRIRHTLCLGASGGGYTALLMGHLLRALEVHAFSPLTRLPSRTPSQMVQLALHGNGWMFRRQWALYFDPSLDRETLNLSDYLRPGNGHTAYHLYYGSLHERDRRHSLAMAGVPGLTLHAYDSDDHQLVSQLRDRGELADIIAAACRRAGADVCLPSGR